MFVHADGTQSRSPQTLAAVCGASFPRKCSLLRYAIEQQPLRSSFPASVLLVHSCVRTAAELSTGLWQQGVDVWVQVLRCQHDNGGFGGSERHDPHLLYTLSAVQILALYDKLHLINADTVAECKHLI